MDLVRSLGADEVVDHTKQQCEDVLRDYVVVLGILKGDTLTRSLCIRIPNGIIVSLIGPLDVAFARARGINFILRAVFGLRSGRIARPARPVIDRVLPFAEAKEALAYLEKGREKGEVVLRIKREATWQDIA